MPDRSVHAVETVGLKKTYFGAVPVKVLHGIDVQVQTSSGGPGGGKPINLDVLGNNQAEQEAAVQAGDEEIGYAQAVRVLLDGLPAADGILEEAELLPARMLAEVVTVIAGEDHDGAIR